jgi:uncharacterized delta-60 repeat protein
MIDPSGITPPDTADFLVRYHLDGSLDPTFGDRGVVALTRVAGRSETYWGFDVLPDGTILAVGSRNLVGSAQGPANRILRRFDVNGHPDPAYGTDGVASLSYGSGSRVENPNWTVTADGRIVLVEYVTTDPGTPPGVAPDVHEIVSRVDAKGAFDGGFGKGGRVEVRLAAPMPGVMADGSIALASEIYWGVLVAGGPAFRQLDVRRLTAAGEPDPAFRTVALNDLEYGATFLPGGKLLAFAQGSAMEHDPSCALIARINADGTLDSSFGTGGKVLGTCDWFNAYRLYPARVGLARSPDDASIVIAGNGLHGGALIRITSCGVRDASFGAGGIASVTLDPSFVPERAPGAETGDTTTLTNVALLPDGHLVATGYTSVTCSDCGIIPKIFVARLDSSGAADAEFPARAGVGVGADVKIPPFDE